MNRGWVPYEKMDPNTRQEAQIEGEVEIEGIIRTEEEKPFISPDHDFRKRVFKYRYIRLIGSVFYLRLILLTMFYSIL